MGALTGCLSIMHRLWTTLVSRVSSAKPSDRFRLTGALVLLVGLLGAGIYYWVEARPTGPSMEDLMPGYTRARERQMGIMMGQAGVLMAEWQDALELPGTQALIGVGVAGLFSLYFFRAAWVMDEEEREAAEQHDR
jgi:hypothetical protein